MKRLFLCLAAFTAAFAAQAQPDAGTISVIPRIGVTLAKISGDKIYTGAPIGNGLDDHVDARYKPGFVGGADVQYQVYNGVALSVGAYYSRQGTRYQNIVDEGTDADGNKTLYAFERPHVHLDYIDVPLMAHLYVAKDLALNFGVQFGFLTKAAIGWNVTGYTDKKNAETGKTERVYDVVDGHTLNNYEASGDASKAYKKFDIGFPVSLSYEYENVVLDAHYVIGLKHVMDDMPSNDQRNKVFQFTVGYKFNL